MTKKSCLKKGLVMALVMGAVLSLAGCPKEAGSSGGGEGSNFNIASVEGTWSYETLHVIFSSDSFSLKIGSLNNNPIEDASGPIIKTLKNNKTSVVGIIVKNTTGVSTLTKKDKYHTFYLKKINLNSSIDMHIPLGEDGDDTLEEAETAFYELSDYPTYIDSDTYLYQ